MAIAATGALLAAITVFACAQPALAWLRLTEEQLDDQSYRVQAALTDFRRSNGWASNFDGPGTGSGSGGLDSAYSIQGIWTEPDDPDGRKLLVIEVAQFESGDIASSADMSPWIWWPSSGDSVTIGRHAGIFEEHTVDGPSPGQSILIGSVAWICSDHDNLAVVCHGEWTVATDRAISGADQMRLLNLAKEIHAKFVDAGICQAGSGPSGGSSTSGSTSGGTSGGAGGSSGGTSGGDSGPGLTWLYYVAPSLAAIIIVALLLILSARGRRARLAKTAPSAGRPSPQGMEHGWYVQSTGAPMGPYPWPTMVDMVSRGLLPPHSLVWHPLTGAWVPAGSIPNLFG